MATTQERLKAGAARLGALWRELPEDVRAEFEMKMGGAVLALGDVYRVLAPHVAPFLGVFWDVMAEVGHEAMPRPLGKGYAWLLGEGVQALSAEFPGAVVAVKAMLGG